MSTWEGADNLLAVGGRWDRRSKRFVGDGARTKLFKLQPAQYEAARTFCAWLRAKLAKRALKVGPKQRALRALLLLGGRRGGKTDVAVRCAIAYAVLFPRSRVWIVGPTIPKTEELDAALREMMPSSWYRHLGAPWHRYTLANGSKITLRSAHNKENLRGHGSADLVVLNEASLMPESTFGLARGATSDHGGLVLMTSNPPEDDPLGQWVADFVAETDAGRRAGLTLHVNARHNPTVDQESLDDMADDMDARRFAAQRDGLILPNPNVVLYSWSPVLNVRPVPQLGNITRTFCERKFGRTFAKIIGFDFQLHPHMAAAIFEAYNDPEDPGGEPLLWLTDYVAIQGNEDALLDELERRGLKGDECACVVDASGDWQGSERKIGRDSVNMMKARKWGNIYFPDAKSKRNPQISERVAAANARFCNGKGKRFVFSAPTNLELNEALKKWENRRGIPYRKSRFAHLCDAVTYVLNRLYPRAGEPAPLTIEIIPRPDRGDWRDL